MGLVIWSNQWEWPGASCLAPKSIQSRQAGFSHFFGGDGSPGDHVLCYCSDLQILLCNYHVIFTPPGASQLCVPVLLRKIKTVKTNFTQDHYNRGKRSQYRSRFNSQYSMNKYKFISIQEDRDQEWKITKRRHLGGSMWNSVYINLIGLFPKTDQADQASPEAWWKMKNTIRYAGWSDIKGGCSS